MIDADPANRIGLGARLRAARERSGHTSIQAAEKLHLEPAIIEALEAENFEALGAPVYVRGHLRRYAMLVGESPGELLLIYDSRATNAAAPDLTRIAHTERVGQPAPLARPIVGVIVALTVVAGVWLALRGLPPVTPRAPAQPELPEPPQPELPQPPPRTATEEGLAIAASPAAGSAAAVPALPPDSPAQLADTQESTRLRLRLSAESWIEVYDAADLRLFYDIGDAGRIIDLAGTAPLRVVLGKVDAVTVEVDGTGRTIPAETRRGDSARFLVDRSGRLTRLR